MTEESRGGPTLESSRDSVATDSARERAPRLTVVMPAHDEASGLQETVAVLEEALRECVDDWELVVVDDGSEDGTFDIIRTLAERDSRIRGIRLSRNFGKEAALACGLKAARGDAVVTMDADLQQPPSVIPEMIERWNAGAKVVHGVKRNRATDSRRARTRARIFNRALSRLAGIDLNDASDFKLLDRIVVDALGRDFPERQRLFRGLAGWVGYPSETVGYTVGSRSEGRSKWSTLRLVDLAVTALVSFTSAPLRIVTILGCLTLALGLVVGTDAVISWVQGRAVSGFATMIITLLIIGSFIMISLGILGEYVAKIYDEIKRRPAYLVQEIVGQTDDLDHGPDD
jgi:glycosyltransferase involved in cell wall biosynthesis